MREPELAHRLSACAGGTWRLRALGASGFCETWQGTAGERRLFIKSAVGPDRAMLDAEADGLRALAATGTIAVPRVTASETGFLAMEWLDMVPPDAGFGARLASALAALHRAPCPLEPARFGWPSDNFIGATPQRNDQCADWIAFYRDRRLGAMLDQLARKGTFTELDDAVRRLMQVLPAFFDDGHVPTPSLIHGDLWQGNWGMLSDGAPVIYDPAVSCSDREAELAMRELFGSAPAGFWKAYCEGNGLADGYAKRKPVYQLYHLLNHAVLFGGGYVQQSLQTAQLCLKSMGS
jgi:protein-ribulosamine 3-kinase